MAASFWGSEKEIAALTVVENSNEIAAVIVDNPNEVAGAGFV